MAYELGTVLGRSTQEQLLLAVRAGNEQHGLDLVRVPQAQLGMQYLTPFRVGSYGKPTHEHIYKNAERNGPMHRAHLILNGLSAGEREQAPGIWDFRNIARLLKNSFPENDLNERLDTLRMDYLDAESTRRQKVAEDLSIIIGKSNVFVCGSVRDDDQIFAAKLTRLESVRSDETLGYEPVITTPSGESLLPEHMYVFQGIYVPTIDQQLPKTI